jgi:hypothetical protein
VNVLPYFQKDHRHATVLAERQAFLLSNAGILNKLSQDFPAQGRSLIPLRLFKRSQHVITKLKVRLLAEPGNGFRNLSGLNFSQLRGYLLRLLGFLSGDPVTF